MNAPASMHHEYRKALDELGRALAAVLASAAERAASDSDVPTAPAPADSTGARFGHPPVTAAYQGAARVPMQQEDHVVSWQGANVVSQEDDRSDRVTSTDKH
jgi:hypothetical protein